MARSGTMKPSSWERCSAIRGSTTVWVSRRRARTPAKTSFSKRWYSETTGGVRTTASGWARGEANRLGHHPAAAVTPDDLVLQAEALAQLNGLGEVAHRDAHLCPPGPKHIDDGPHDEHVGAVGQVNPDPHRAPRRRP